MGLLADLPIVHLELLSAIDRIDRDLERMHRASGDPGQLRRATDRAANRAVRMRRDLEEFFERERLELVPRVRRICGDGVDEIETLLRLQDRMLEALDHFIAELTEEDIQDGYGREHLASMRHLFEEFVDCYDERCRTERRFYRTYSTILFPGGLSAD